MGARPLQRVADVPDAFVTLLDSVRYRESPVLDLLSALKDLKDVSHLERLRT